MENLAFVIPFPQAKAQLQSEIAGLREQLAASQPWLCTTDIFPFESDSLRGGGVGF